MAAAAVGLLLVRTPGSLSAHALLSALAAGSSDLLARAGDLSARSSNFAA